MTPFERALQHTLGIEGGFSADAADSGGATRWGITEAVAREFGYQGEMKDLPLEFAADVYRQKYWNLLQLDLVAALNEQVATELCRSPGSLSSARSTYSTANRMISRTSMWTESLVLRRFARFARTSQFAGSLESAFFMPP